MLIVISLHFILRDLHFGADFAPDDFLGDDLVAQVLLEVFKAHALFLRGFFHFFDALQVHLLADFIQLLDDLGIAGNAHVFALLHQQVLVDQIAQHVLLVFGESGVSLRAKFLLQLVQQLVAAALEFRAGDDVAVDAGDDLLNDRIGRQRDRQQ